MNNAIQRTRFPLLVAFVCAATCVVADDYTFSQVQNFKITYTGAKVSDFPLLLKLDETKVPGLYTTVQNVGADLKFSSLDGGTEYPYEVDTWNPSGTSLVWVKVPSFEKDAQFRMHYGCAAKTANPDSVQVWSAYAGVWHLNEALDSSGKDLDTDGTTHTTKFLGGSQQVSDAPVGVGRGQPSAGVASVFTSKVYDNAKKTPMQLNDATRISVSCWARPTAAMTTWKTFVGPRTSHNGGWGVTPSGSAAFRVENQCTSSAWKSYNLPTAGEQGYGVNKWTQFAFVFDGTSHTVYMNGALVGAATELSGSLAWCWTGWMGWGGVVGENGGDRRGNDQLAIDFDECRLYDGAVDAARVAADYAVATGDYCEAVSAEVPYVSIDSLTADLAAEYVPTTLNLEAVATLHNQSGTIVYHWDLDGDGEFDDLEGAGNATVELPLTEAAKFTPGVRVTVDGTELVAQKVLDNPIEVRAHDVTLTFEVVKRMSPGEIVFTAAMDGATGECTYSWDFDNDGTIDREGTSATETWECPLPGRYNARVRVVDSVGLAGEGVSSEAFVVNGTFYADGNAEVNGDGSVENPFNNMRSLAERINDGDKAFVRGIFVVGDEKAAIAVAAGNIVIDKWGDEKAVITSTNKMFVAENGIFVFNGENVVLSNLVFNMTKESFSKANIVRFNGNDVTMGKCDFSVVGGSVQYMWGYAGGVGTSGNPIQRGLLIEDCTFNGFRDGGREVYAVTVGENATIARCVFENVSSAVRANGNSGGNFCFVSNVVLNAQSTNVTSSAAGVVVSGAWNKFSNSTIAYNRFVNANGNEKAGCVIFCTSKTGQNGIFAHHNTVVGYKAFASFDNTTTPWTFKFCDNLLVDCDFLFKDTATAATYAINNAGCIRNNYYTGAFRDVPEGYSFSEKMVVEGNVALATAPRFVKPKEPTSPDFYRAKVQYKTDDLMVGGWTDGGKCPAYIGAVEPVILGGMVLYIR